MKHIINKINNTLSVLAVVFAVAMLSASCEHKELYMLQPQKQLVNIQFNWDELQFGDEKPEGMSLYFYSDRTDEMYKFDIPTTDEDYPIEIYSGLYDLICYNNDEPAIASRFTNDLDEHDILAMELNNQVPTMYGNNYEVEIEYREEGNTEPTQVITITPKRINNVYTVVVNNTNVISNAQVWNASLSGLTNSIYADNGKCSNNASESVISFPLTNSTFSNSCTNSIRTFGQLYNKSNKNTPNKLLLTVLKADKTVVYYLFNVTGQIESAVDPHNVIIAVDLENATPLQPGDPDYPNDNPVQAEGGLNAGVDEFGNENIDIIVK